ICGETTIPPRCWHYPGDSLMKRCLCSSLAVVLIWTANLAFAEVSLPKIFGDHMVLQQDSEVPIWGSATTGEKVVVTLGDSKAEAAGGADGRWLVRIKTPKAGGEPLVLKVEGSNAIEFKDVLAGEVWVCSGQSNMEWPVSASDKAKEEAEAA